MKERGEARRGLQSAKKDFGLGMKSSKKEAAARKEAEAERDTAVEHAYQLSKSL